MERYSNQIYVKYFRMGQTAYRDKVRFYEDNPEAISSLYFDDKLEIDIDYFLCLFEVGRYERYLSNIDPLIELIIKENIYEFRNEDIFRELLFRKAACLYQLNQYEKSKTILKQLVKMDQSNPIFIGLFTICNRKLENDTYTSIKALAIVSFMLVMSITVARIFLIEPFFDIYLEPFLLLRKILLIFGITCLIGLEISFQYNIYKETGMYTHKLLNRVFGTKA